MSAKFCWHCDGFRQVGRAELGGEGQSGGGSGPPLPDIIPHLGPSNLTRDHQLKLRESSRPISIGHLLLRKPIRGQVCFPLSDPSCLFPSSSNFTRQPHLAGTPENLRFAEHIQAQWEEFGLDSVQLAPYEVLLSYPNETNPNYISIVDEQGQEVKRVRLEQSGSAG